MDAREAVEPRATPGAIRKVVTGTGIAWVVNPVIVVLAAMARGTEGGGWVLPALVALGLTSLTGLLLGWLSLGWLGLSAAAVGAISELTLPYLVIPQLLGFTIWGVGVYGEYVPGTLAAAVAAILGTSIGARVAQGRTLPVTWTLVAGLCVFAAWFGIWLVMGRSIGVPA